jgi:uridine phosphorylase
MLAQELLEEPKMSNHARGLWGYTGLTAAGEELTVQSTGMGGPSAAVVLADLAELGVRRAIRIGTCTSLKDRVKLGEMAIVSEAFPEPGGSFRMVSEEEAWQPVVEPNLVLTHKLARALGAEARGVISVSLDLLHRPETEVHPAAEVADMQTAALFATGLEFEISVAALLVVERDNKGETLGDEELAAVAKRAGVAAAKLL